MHLPDWSGLAAWAQEAGFDACVDEAAFAKLLGVEVSELPESCRDAVRRADFRYRAVTGSRRDEVILRVLQRIDSGQLSTAGEEGHARWEKGWNENYEALLESGNDVGQLTPRYIHPGRPLRLDGDYVVARDPYFELAWYEAFRDWLFTTHLPPFAHVYEFACGPCHNIAALARQFPDKHLHALDWASPSVKIAQRLHEVHGWKIEGRHFDFFQPDEAYRMEPHSAAMTIGGLEQVGDRFQPFFDYLLAQQPGLVIHVEPFLEWYQEDHLMDYLAVRHHRVRKYLNGYVPHLQAMETAGRIEILRAQPIRFGSLFHDGYSVLVWRPRAS